MELTLDQALQKGIEAHKAGRAQEADRYYTAILKANSRHPDANHNMGVLAVSIGKVNEALPFFKTAIEVNPEMPQYWLSYIDALIREKQFDNAKQVLEQARKQGVDGGRLDSLEAQLSPTTEPPNTTGVSPPQELLNSLLGHYQNGRLGDAEKLAVEITQKFPKHPFAWKVLGAVLRATGRKSEAADANQTAVALSPQDAEAHSNLGITLQELGRLAEAEASYNQAIALKPDYAEAHYNLGNILLELSRLAEAEMSYKRAIAFKSDFAEAHYNVGNTLKELGRLEEAVVSYNQAVALKPDFAESHYNLGNTLKELGRLEEAEASYTQVIALRPGHVEALTNRSYLLFSIGEYDAALSDADACILPEKSRELPLISLYALGRIDEIYQRLEVQSKDNPDNISLAAFAAYISEVQKKPTKYNFCPNPIDFIYTANLSSHVSETGAYVAGLIEELNKIDTIWEPVGKTTVGGFQSPNSINLFESPFEKIAQLKSILITEIKAYHLKFQNEPCSYIQRFPSVNNLHGWTVTLKQQGHQDAHIHPFGWLSGVIYLKVVPSLGKEEGAIEFSLNGQNYHDVNSSKLTFQPEVGDIVFFPSSLHHRTIPFSTNEDRIIVSFDLMPD